MKKILSTVAALGLVAGVATTASAVEFSVSGSYAVEGVYLSSADGSGLDLNSAAGEDEAGNDAYWYSTFEIKPVMKVNDKMSVKSTILLADDMWGSQGDNGISDTDSNIEVEKLYMEYKSAIGKVRIGRAPSGSWSGDFLNNDSHANRVQLFPKFTDNLTGSFYAQKSKEGDSTTAATETDADSDGYSAGLTYKADGLVACLAVDYARDASAAGKLTDFMRLKGYYNQNFAKMYAEVEFAILDGETDSDTAGADTDKSSFGLMADVGMNMDKLDVGMMLIYASGDGDGDADSDDLGSLGELFQPYSILTGAHTGMMVTDTGTADTDMTKAGIVSLGVHADFAVSNVLSLHSALAYAQAEDELQGYDDDYGWEVDLGMSYNLMDNLTYQVDVAYLLAGDFFEYGDSTTDVEDVYTLTHKLTMEF